MEAHLELWIGGDARLLGMDSDAITVGRGADNDIALPFDPTVSRLHTVISRYRAGWCLRDVGSSNGTFLNGERLLREQLLHSGDEIRVGRDAHHLPSRSES